MESRWTEHLQEHFGCGRFDEVSFSAEFEGAGAVAVFGGGGKDEHWHRIGQGRGAEVLENLETANIRKFQIQEND